MKDQVVVITGASSGIGRACAVAFAGRGASLAIVARSQDKLNETYSLVKGLAPHVLPFNTDITDHECVKELFQEVKNKFGRIDILINRLIRLTAVSTTSTEPTR